MRASNVALLNEILEEDLRAVLANGDEEAFRRAMAIADKCLEHDKNVISQAKIDNDLVKINNDKHKDDNQYSLDKEKILLDKNKAESQSENERIKIETNAQIETMKDKTQNRKIDSDYDLKYAEIADKNKSKKIDISSGMVIKTVEIALAALVIPAIEHKYKMEFAKRIIDFEKEGIFTTSAGRSLSKIFKW